MLSSRQMTEREMLYLVYGAMKANEGADSLGDVIKLLEEFLWPPDNGAKQAKKLPDHMAAIRHSAAQS